MEKADMQDHGDYHAFITNNLNRLDAWTCHLSSEFQGSSLVVLSRNPEYRKFRLNLLIAKYDTCI